MDAHIQLVSFPPTIKLCCSDVKLSTDALHENGVPFLTMMPEYANYGAESAADTTKCETL